MPPNSKKKRKVSGGSASSGASHGPVSPLVWTGPKMLAVLPADRELSFIGSGVITVQSGEVNVFGKTIAAADGPVELHADERAGGALAIEVGGRAQVPLSASQDAVFSIDSLPDAPCAQCAPAQQQAVAAGGAPSFRALPADDPAAPRPVALPPEWRAAAHDLCCAADEAAAQGTAPTLIVVVGAKKVGKSSFARYLANALLGGPAGRVAYLDTDPGQPEFTPPGLVSVSLLQKPVLGPPHSHLRPPELSFFVGDTSAARDPERYLHYLQLLYLWYQQQYLQQQQHDPGGPAQQQQSRQQQRQPPPPLVVNTHGWVRGLGLELLAELLRALPATHVVHITAGSAHRDLPAGRFWLASGAGGANAGGSGDAEEPTGPPIVRLPPLPGAQPGGGGDGAEHSTASGRSGGGGEGSRSRGGPLAAADLRTLQWAAFARQCIAAAAAAGGDGQQEQRAAGGADLAERLAAAVPYEARWGDLAVRALHAAVPPGELPRALNGAVVGLCCSAAPAGGPPRPARCLGLGIARAVDMEALRVYLLCALGPEEMQEVDTLQVGCLELPASLLASSSGRVASPYLSAFCLPGVGTGAAAIKSRNNLLRPSQL